MPDLSTVALAALALSSLAGATVAMTRERRVRPVGWRASRRAEAAARADENRAAQRLSVVKWWLQIHDAMRHRHFVRHLAKVQSLSVEVGVALRHVQGHFVVALAELRRVFEHRGPAADTSPPTLTKRQAGFLNYAFILPGDLAIVSGALTAHDAKLPLLLSVASALAMSVTLWACGKWAGAALAAIGEGEEGHGRPWMIAVPVAGILVGSIALGQLRPTDHLLWTMLSALPAIASMAVTVLSKSSAWDTLFKVERRFRASDRRLHRSLERLRRVGSRLAAETTTASTRGVALLTAVPAAIANDGGLADAPAIGVSETVNALGDVVRRLGAAGIVITHDTAYGATTISGDSLDQVFAEFTRHAARLFALVGEEPLIAHAATARPEEPSAEDEEHPADDEELSADDGEPPEQEPNLDVAAGPSVVTAVPILPTINSIVAESVMPS